MKINNIDLDMLMLRMRKLFAAEDKTLLIFVVGSIFEIVRTTG